MSFTLKANVECIFLVSDFNIEGRFVRTGPCIRIQHRRPIDGMPEIPRLRCRGYRPNRGI